MLPFPLNDVIVSTGYCLSLAITAASDKSTILDNFLPLSRTSTHTDNLHRVVDCVIHSIMATWTSVIPTFIMSFQQVPLKCLGFAFVHWVLFDGWFV